MANFGPLEVLVLLIFWIGLSFLVARFAERKGQSFVAFLVLGLVASWVISLIVALVVPERGDVEVQTVGGPAEPPKRLEELQKLTELRTAGSLSDDEFEAEKARILKQA